LDFEVKKVGCVLFFVFFEVAKSNYIFASVWAKKSKKKLLKKIKILPFTDT